MQLISDTPWELFGMGAIQHFFREPDHHTLLQALSDCDLYGNEAFMSALGKGCPVESYSLIDQIAPESLQEYFEGYASLDNATQQLLDAFFSLRQSGRVLEIGCGAGRFLDIFKQKGFDTLGIDISKLMVWLCEKRGLGPVYSQGLENLGNDLAKFDCFLLLGYNLGLYGELNCVVDMFKRCAALSAANALMLVHSIDIEACDQDFALTRKAYNQQFPDRHPGETNYVMQFGEITGSPFPWIHLGPEDVKVIAANTGWLLEQVFWDCQEAGNWAGVLRLS